jgi:hypothetical protein
MNVFEQNGMFKASRITGPKHNYLGLAFSELDQDIELIKKQLQDDKECKKTVDSSELSRIVREAVMSEVEKHQQKIFVSKLEFVPTDSLDLSAYVELAKAIAAHALEKHTQMISYAKSS